MKCARFAVELEDHLALHPAETGKALPTLLGEHARICGSCRSELENALRSRVLLASLRATEAITDTAPADPFFYTRLRVRIQSEQATRSRHPLRSLRVAKREVAFAAALFVATLGSFVYNVRHTEYPNADEAMVFDVPHHNPMHPSDDHRQPQTTDAMVSLIAP